MDPLETKPFNNSNAPAPSSGLGNNSYNTPVPVPRPAASPNPNRVGLVIAAIILVVAAAVFWIFYKHPAQKNNPTQNPGNQTQQNTSDIKGGKEVNGTFWFRPSEVPSYFPADFAFPEGAVMNNGYVKQISGIRVESARVFLTTDTAKQVQKFYTDYLKTAGFSITDPGKIVEGENFSMSANKNTVTSVVITVEPNPTLKQNFVTVKYFTNK